MKKGLFHGLGGLHNVVAVCEGQDLVSIIHQVVLWNDRQLFWAICNMRAHYCPSPWQCEFTLGSLSCDNLKAHPRPSPIYLRLWALPLRLFSLQAHTVPLLFWCEGSSGPSPMVNFFFVCSTGSALVPTTEFQLPVFTRHWLHA